LFPGNATNNLWVLDLTLGILDIRRQAELQLFITLSAIRNYNHDNILNASVITDFISPPLELTRKLAAERVKVKVTLRLTVSQSVNLGVEPHLGLMTRYLVVFDNYGSVCVERPL
jgi:hypothetical protein